MSVEICSQKECGTVLPDKESPEWVGWLSGTFRRITKETTLGEATTFAVCPDHTMVIVLRKPTLQLDPDVKVPSVTVWKKIPKRWFSDVCPGCRENYHESKASGWGILRLVRALKKGDVERVFDLCPNCSVEVR